MRKKETAEVQRAHRIVTNAIKKGELVRPEICSMADGHCNGPICAHHEDYSNPLDVIWLCNKHHRGVHAQKRRSLPKALSNSKKHYSIRLTDLDADWLTALGGGSLTDGIRRAISVVMGVRAHKEKQYLLSDALEALGMFARMQQNQ